MILDPALVVDSQDYQPFERGFKNDVFIKWPNGTESPDYDYTNSSIMIGYVCQIFILLNLETSILYN